MSYRILFTKQALKELKTFSPKLRNKLRQICLNVLAVNPYVGKKLLGSLKGSYSYRLNIKDRIIYSIDKKEKQIYIKKVKTHYGD